MSWGFSAQFLRAVLAVQYTGRNSALTAWMEAVCWLLVPLQLLQSIDAKVDRETLASWVRTMAIAQVSKIMRAVQERPSALPRPPQAHSHNKRLALAQPALSRPTDCLGASHIA